VEAMKDNDLAGFLLMIGLVLFIATGCASTPDPLDGDHDQGTHAHLVERAIDLARAGESVEAKAVLQQLIREGNRDQDVLLALSVCAKQTGDLRLAFWSIEECARIHSHGYESLYNLGVLYRVSKSYREAADAFRLALEYPEHTVECLAEYTFSLAMLGELEKVELDNLIVVEQEHPDPLWRDWAFQQRVQFLSAQE